MLVLEDLSEEKSEMEKIPLCFIIKWKFISLCFLKVMIIAGRYRQLYHLGWWYKEERSTLNRRMVDHWMWEIWTRSPGTRTIGCGRSSLTLNVYLGSARMESPDSGGPICYLGSTGKLNLDGAVPM